MSAPATVPVGVITVQVWLGQLPDQVGVYPCVFGPGVSQNLEPLAPGVVHQEQRDTVVAGDWLGEVVENVMPHKIMVPFKFEGKYIIKKITAAGQYNVNEVIAVLADSKNNEAVPLRMIHSKRRDDEGFSEEEV